MSRLNERIKQLEDEYDYQTEAATLYLENKKKAADNKGNAPTDTMVVHVE